MPLFRVQVRQANQSTNAIYKWSNLFHVSAADIPAAISVGQEIAQLLRPALKQTAFVYEIYASDMVPNTSVYDTAPVLGNQRGTFLGSADLLPAWNVVRVDIDVAGFGRPSRKFHRVPLGEAESTNGVLDGAVLALISTAYQNICGIEAVVDESGNNYMQPIVKGITSRRLGKLAYTAVPPLPAA